MFGSRRSMLAAGDLTIADIIVKNRDETRDLAHSFNQMKDNLRKLLSQVNASSEQVAASAEELMASTEQVTLATNEVARTIQEMSNRATSAGRKRECQGHGGGSSWLPAYCQIDVYRLGNGARIS